MCFISVGFPIVAEQGLPVKKLDSILSAVLEGGFYAILLLLICHANRILREARGSTRFETPAIDNGRLIHEMCMYSPRKFEIRTFPMEYKFSARA